MQGRRSRDNIATEGGDYTAVSPRRSPRSAKSNSKSPSQVEGGAKDEAEDASEDDVETELNHLTGDHAPYLQLVVAATAALFMMEPAVAPSVWDNEIEPAPAPEWVRLTWAISDQIHATGTAASLAFASTVTTAVVVTLWLLGLVGNVDAMIGNDAAGKDTSNTDDEVDVLRLTRRNDHCDDGSDGSKGVALTPHDLFPAGTALTVFVAALSWAIGSSWSPLEVSDGEPGKRIHPNLVAALESLSSRQIG